MELNAVFLEGRYQGAAEYSFKRQLSGRHCRCRVWRSADVARTERSGVVVEEVLEPHLAYLEAMYSDARPLTTSGVAV